MFELIKEIKSLKGDLVFRRYHILSTPWFKCYLHRIYRADADDHLHNHPWNFCGIILWGGYLEERIGGVKTRKFGSILRGNVDYFHKTKFVYSPTTTLFFRGRDTWAWGYFTADGVIENEKYRELKHSGKLPGRP